MATFDESILTEIKKMLGLAEDDTTFDTDVRIHVNSALGTLSQLGIGPEGGYEIADASATWTDLLLTDLNLSPTKSYIYLRVKLLFDPPQQSWNTVAMKEQIQELEWRLNVVREDLIPIPEDTTPSYEDDEELLLDGGVI